MRPGDFALERGHGLVAAAIRLGTRSRFNHAKLVISENGDVLESLADGAEYGTVKPTDLVIETPLTDAERAAIPDIATLLYGTPYAWLDVVAIGLAQFGIVSRWSERRLARPDRLFCSQLVDYAWSLAGFKAFNDGRPPQAVSPGDLADLAFVDSWRVLQKPAGYQFHE